MKYSLSPFTAVLLLLLTVVGCKPDPEIITPPPPAPEVFPDCSYSFTTAVIDTNWSRPLFDPPGGFTDDYYEGYLVRDISFNPNNPNQMVVALEARNIPVLGIIGSDTQVLLVVDLCTGEESVIYQEFTNSGVFYDVDWGMNDRIICATPGSNCALILDPDGTNQFTVPAEVYNYSVDHIVWHPDGESFLFTPVNDAWVFDLEGNLLSENSFHSGNAFAYLPDGRVAFAEGYIGIFDPNTSTDQLVDEADLFVHDQSVAYYKAEDALFWCSDSIVAFTSTQTGQRTELVHGFTQNRLFSAASVSQNGYLAYIAEVISANLSNSGTFFWRTEIRFINPDGTDERRLVLDFE